MKESTKEILLIWFRASQEAKDNSSLQLKYEGYFTDICAARMSVCGVADKHLYSLPVKTDNNEYYPEELVRHLKAEKDKGCSNCWLRSDTDKNHPECNDKITEWFASNTALKEYIELVLL